MIISNKDTKPKNAATAKVTGSKNEKRNEKINNRTTTNHAAKNRWVKNRSGKNRVGFMEWVSRN